MDELLKWIFTINLATFIALLTFGYKILRFINRMEFKVDLMWQDYEARMRMYQHQKEESGLA